MQDDDGRSVNRLTDPRAFRALAHPTRIALLGLLRSEGPLTATRAGELLGESSASASFHLRQLAKYGLAEEAGGGHGRERPWRATALFTFVPDVAESPEFARAVEMFTTALAERYFDQLVRWLEVRPTEPEEWQRATGFGDRTLYLTASELTAINEQLTQVLDSYLDRLTSPALRPPGARLVSYIPLGFPAVDRPSGQLEHGRDPDGGGQ